MSRLDAVRVAGAPARWPDWAQVLAVYLASRVVTFVVTERTARFQPANVWTGADPGYLDFIRIWDGEWYHRIFDHGYPLPLPVDAIGQPFQSEWAFFPAYPLLVRGVATVTGLDWRVAAPTVSVLLGAAAVVVMYRLFRLRAGHRTSLAAIALFCVFPSSPVLQYAYSESLGMLALVGALWLLAGRRYLLCVLPVLLLGLTRAVVVPFGVVVAVHLVHRWLRRRNDALPARQIAAIVLLGASTVLAAAAWPAYVALRTGQADAYTRVQSAWRGGQVEWLTPWWGMSRYLLGGWFGPLVLLGLLVAFAALLASRTARVLGVDLTAWCAAYVAYLLVVIEPFTSIFRYLLLLFPLALVVASTVRSRAHLVAWLWAMLSLQVVWVVWLWRFTPPSDLPP